MGVFLQTAIIPNCDEAAAKTALEKIAKENPDFELEPTDCQYQQRENGVQILCNEYCMAYEDLARTLSLETGRPSMLLYIYDDDFWGYFLYENGTEIDQFNPLPEYFEKVSEEEQKRLAGNPSLIAGYFDVQPENIENYLCLWSDELLDSDEEELAYPDDECSKGDCWQMVDFMNKLGYPYDFE